MDLLLDLDMVPPDESDNCHDYSTFVSIEGWPGNAQGRSPHEKMADWKTNRSYSTQKTLEGRMHVVGGTCIFRITFLHVGGEGHMKTAHRKWIALGVVLLLLASLGAAQDRTIVMASYGVGNRDRADVTAVVQSHLRNGALVFAVSNDDLGGDPERGIQKDLSILVRERSGRISEYHFVEGEVANLQLSSYYRSQLSPEAQRHFDNQYSRWMEYRQRHDRDEAEESEQHMRDIMRANNIPLDTPYEFVASGGIGSDAAWQSIQIELATWGAGTSRADVTNRLQGMVRNNSLQFRVTNDAMGGDPAQGHHKQLIITYSYRGERRQAVANEGDYLRIP
jgi:hypothetical protein